MKIVLENNFFSIVFLKFAMKKRRNKRDNTIGEAII